MCPSCSDAAIEEHSNGPVPGEPSLEMLVEMRAIACDDNGKVHLPLAVRGYRSFAAPFMARSMLAVPLLRDRPLS
jgi:hypothetical protein